MMIFFNTYLHTQFFFTKKNENKRIILQINNPKKATIFIVFRNMHSFIGPLTTNQHP